MICFLSFGILSTYADSTDVNSSNFTIDLYTMDPLKGSHAQGSWVGGIDSFKEILASITDVLLFIIPTLAVVSFLVAGYFYIFSWGDSEKAGRAKTIIKWNIVAIFVALLSYGIVNIVASFFN